MICPRCTHVGLLCDRCLAPADPRDGPVSCSRCRRDLCAERNRVKAVREEVSAA